MTHLSKPILHSWLWAVLWCGLIFFFSSIPNYTGKEVNFETLSGILEFSLRKFAHLFEYAVLFILLYRAVQLTWQEVPPVHFLLSFSLTVLYAISDEVHQSYIFGRSGNGFDVFVDTLGALGGYFLTTRKSSVFYSLLHKIHKSPETEIQRSPLG